MIETRGESGLFLCAPTSGYELIQKDFQNISVLSAEEIETLLSVARSFNQAKVSTDSFAHCGQQSSIRNRPGDDFNDNGRSFIKQVLQKHGWKYIREDVLNECWQRPDKIGKQHSATLHRELPLFHVFSANAQPFEGGKTYNFFQVYAILEHLGDLSVAARALAEQGYGDSFLREPVKLPEFITSFSEEEAEEYDDCPDEKFPEHLLNVPGFVNEFSRFINETSFVIQPVYALAAALAFQALLCAQNVKDPTGIRSNLYLIVAGRSASGKERGREIVKEILTKLENNSCKKLYLPNKFIIEDVASYQALVKSLASNHGVLLWLWDEIGKVFPALNTDRTSNLSGIIPVIMRLYTSANSFFQPHVKAGNDKALPVLQQPNLVLYGTTVKEVLFNAFTAESLTDGLIGRLMIFEGNDSAKRRKLHTVPPVPESIVETADWWFAKRANNINQDIPQPFVVPVTEEAEGVFDKFYQVHEQIQSENDPIKDALWGRRVQQARQFALVYACSVSKENPIVDEHAAHWAYALVTYLIKRKITIADRHVADGEFDRKQKMVLRFIESCKGRCTLSMLCRRFRSLKKREREEILENLLATKAVRTEERMVEGSRKKTTVLVLNKK